MKKSGKVLLISTAVLLMAAVFFVIITNNMPLKKVAVPKTLTGAAGGTGGISIVIVGDTGTAQLFQGWNFVSIFVKLNNHTITQVLSSLGTSYDYILEWNSSSQEFDTWSRLGTKEFTELNSNKSYFIYMSQAGILDLNGRYYGNLSFPLISGWETPNYIYEYESNITNSSFYSSNFSYMQKWNTTSQEFLIYSEKSSLPQFTKLLAGEGYLILTEGANITYIRA